MRKKGRRRLIISQNVWSVRSKKLAEEKGEISEDLWSYTGMTPKQGTQVSGAFSPFSSPPLQPDQQPIHLSDNFLAIHYFHMI
ncbi:hypothetical protein EDM59_19135 [Brevibacillus nitrificans]|uniref:Uncharacterized protein n=1 Tax=Brevibacillus nitrificans TaxID=651560 RepID=A0A3M8D529_9BACL|nr:hypothetical protein EDM59_19135 [Brevibacillus nitrificans]